MLKRTLLKKKNLRRGVHHSAEEDKEFPETAAFFQDEPFSDTSS
jgi:hypothetical protein